MAKSQLAFSLNVPLERKEALSSWFGIPVSHGFGIYLGMPLLYCRVGKGTYHFLIEKIRKKLSAWKQKHMSMATRALLIQLSTSTIANMLCKPLSFRLTL